MRRRRVFDYNLMMKFLIAAFLAFAPRLLLAQAPPDDSGTKVDVTFSGGHDTVGEDRGRPVILIAAALKVPDQVFRDAFKGVHPAGPGSGGPTDEEARANKRVLMDALSPYGVTDERLNEVSNYYRYRRSAGEMWRNAPAKAFATVRNGVVTSVTITVTVPGITPVSLTPTLSFGTDFAKNGAIKEIKIGP
jgi:hypothetical protein